MKKSVWISMIVAGACILAGLACIAVGHGLGGHHTLAGGEGVALVTTTLTPAGDFDSISVDALSADMTLLPAEDGVCRVEAKDQDKIRYTAEVIGGTLLIRATDTRAWYEHLFSFNGGDAALTVYLPDRSYASLNVELASGDVEVGRDFTFTGDVSLNATTGDLTLSAAVEGHTTLKTTTGNIHAEGKHTTLTVKVTTGDITLRHLDAKEISVTATSGDVAVKESVAITLSAVTGTGSVRMEDLIIDENLRVSTSTGDHTLLRILCRELDLHATTGRVEMTETVAMEHAGVETTTGSVSFTRSDAATLSVRTTTGSVRGSLLTSKVFYTATNSGSVNVPKSTVGGLCEIKTTSGSIHITIEE